MPTPDSRDLTTLTALKGWLGSTASGDDAALGALITAASCDFLQRCNRDSIKIADYTEQYDGNGNRTNPLLHYPISAVTAVSIDGAPVPASSGACVGGYLFDRFCLRLIGYCFTPGVQNVVVTYSAGYAVIPPEVTQAVNSICASWWRRRQWTDQASKSLAGEVVAFRKEDIAPEAQRVVDQYTRRIPL